MKLLKPIKFGNPPKICKIQKTNHLRDLILKLVGLLMLLSSTLHKSKLIETSD